MEIWIRALLAVNKLSKNYFQLGLLRWKEEKEEN